MAANKKKKASMVKRPKNPDQVLWLDNGWQPCFIAFCPSLKAWKSLCRKFKCAYDPDDYSKHDAAVHIFEEGEGKEAFVVTIHERFDAQHGGHQTPAVVALLVHEVVHIWQHILKHINEKGTPSIELEAYSVQAIFTNVYRAYLDTRIRKCKSST